MSELKTKNMNIAQIAKLCHQANKVYCESLGDESQVDWEHAPDWQRQSAINGVENILRSDFPTMKSNHDNWLKEKKETGWKYGPVKDTEKKEHPCFVEYDELPEEQKFKDVLFMNIVKLFKE